MKLISRIIRSRYLESARGKGLSQMVAYARSRLAVDRILKTIDLEQFKIFQERYKNADPPPGYSKYLDIRTWMLGSLYYLFLLGLNKSRPLRVLDLGTGAGYFPYACSLYGHKVVGLDLGTVSIYNDICEFLRVDRKTWRINRFERLPDFGLRFDLVTAFAIKFNQHDSPEEWQAKEWSFLLEDLRRNQLVEAGRIFLSFNSCRDGHWCREPVLQLFGEQGCRVYPKMVDIGVPKPNFLLDFLDRWLMAKAPGG